MDRPEPRDAFETRPRRKGDDPGRSASIVFGLIIIAVGLWFFADDTLGLDLPELDWGAAWPLVLIGLGVWIVLGAMNRR
jgi:hypothetical protein